LLSKYGEFDTHEAFEKSGSEFEDAFVTLINPDGNWDDAVWYQTLQGWLGLLSEGWMAYNHIMNSKPSTQFSKHVKKILLWSGSLFLRDSILFIFGGAFWSCLLGNYSKNI